MIACLSNFGGLMRVGKLVIAILAFAFIGVGAEAAGTKHGKHSVSATKRKISSDRGDEGCERSREKCGSRCNTEAGDDDVAWEKCFKTCAGECYVPPKDDATDEDSCGRTRELCGSRCNTEAGDDDKAWNKCFKACADDCYVPPKTK